MELKQQSIIGAGIALLCVIYSTSAQITYHLDANTNSYTLQTPNSQQSFTRYFNGQRGAGAASPIQTAQSQPQQQFSAASPQQFAYQNGQDELNNYFRQQQQLQQQQRQSEQNLYTTYQIPQQQQQQQQQLQQERQAQQISPQDLAVYFQQVQQAQLQQQQEQQLASTAPQRFAEASQPQQPSYDNSQQQLQYQQQPQQFAPQFQSQSLKQTQQQAPANNLLGVAFSPSNEVSHVKYESEGLNYNF